MTTEQAVDTAALDAWLAEHLDLQCRYDSRALTCRIVMSQHPLAEDDPNGHDYASPDLTTGDGMLMVLEAMGARGWDWHIESVEGAWWLRLEHDDGRLVGYSPLDGNSTLTGPTCPTAVALAARSALEAEAH